MSDPKPPPTAIPTDNNGPKGPLSRTANPAPAEPPSHAQPATNRTHDAEEDSLHVRARAILAELGADGRALGEQVAVVGRWLLERGLGLIAAGEVRAGCDVLAQVRQLAQVEGRGSVAELPAVPEAGSEDDPLPGIEAKLEKARRFRLRPKPGIPVRADLRQPTTRGDPPTGRRRGLPSTSVMAEYEVRRTLDDILYPAVTSADPAPAATPAAFDPGQPAATEPEPEPDDPTACTPQGG